MVVVQLVNAYGPRTGGIRTHVDCARREDAKRGVTAGLIYPAAETATLDDELGPVRTIASPRLLINPDYRNLWNHRAVLSVIDELQPDAVEILDKYTLPRLGPILRRRGIPNLGFSSERLTDVLLPYLGGSALTGAAIRGYNRWFARQFETVVCHSRYAASELQAVGADNVTVVPLGVDLERYHPDRRDEALRAELLDGAEVLLLYVGRLVSEKRVGLLGQLMRRLAARADGRRFRLVLAGSGPEASKPELAESPQTTQLGFLNDRDELAALYASCDLFVFPSAIESFALSVLEAAAAGCRVVGAAGGAVLEVAEPSFARLVEQDPAAFEAAVDAMLAVDPAAARQAARARAERYRWSTYAETILAMHGEARR